MDNFTHSLAGWALGQAGLKTKSRKGLAALIAIVLGAVALAGSARAADFPAVDSSNLSISLVRSGCYGDCPDYKVTIDGTGRVIFSTREPPLEGSAEAFRIFYRNSVVAPGRHEDRISASAVAALVERFRDAKFFSLQNEYRARITDQPTFLLAIDTGHGTKAVLDYAGRSAGMPAEVEALEDAVDLASGSGRWVFGASGLIAQLEKEGLDFQSVVAVEILYRATAKGSDDTLREFVLRGAPLNAQIGDYRYGPVIAASAIRNGRVELFSMLADRGVLQRAPHWELTNVFAKSAAGCDPRMAAEAVRRGLEVDAVVRSSGSNDRFNDMIGRTAFGMLANKYACLTEEARLATARALIRLGANPNKPDGEGKTPLFRVSSPEFARFLLAQGADPTLLDRRGHGAIYGRMDDEIVALLLEAGSKPVSRYNNDKTLYEMALNLPMPKTLEWLRAHPKAMAIAKAQ